ncbi:MAG: RsmE family RNA methyltransferase [Eubacteriales bacterium]|nr:RsmE family RNA methyltransferase [Eubacteriales bacterium]
MHRFFVKPEQWNEEDAFIEGEDYNHIHNVLRMKAGEELLVCDEGEKEYQCKIVGYDETLFHVNLEIVDVFGNARELPTELVLFQGYPKGDKLEWIVQKAVELGVSKIVPVSMKRCVVKLDDKKAAKKVERMSAIGLSAAKQSKRGKIPEVTSVMSMKEACEYAKTLEYVLLPYENAEGMEAARTLIANAKGKKSVGIFIGPEGGFAPEEVAMIEAIGGKTMSLGHRILRTETAGMTILSLLMFLIDED